MPPSLAPAKSGRGGRGEEGQATPVVAVRAHRGNIGVYFTGLGAVFPVVSTTPSISASQSGGGGQGSGFCLKWIRTRKRSRSLRRCVQRPNFVCPASRRILGTRSVGKHLARCDGERQHDPGAGRGPRERALAVSGGTRRIILESTVSTQKSICWPAPKLPTRNISRSRAIALRAESPPVWMWRRLKRSFPIFNRS